MMRAISSNLKLEEKSLPRAPGVDEVIVKVRFFGVTQDDAAAYKAGVPIAQLGTDFSGEVLYMGTSSGTKTFREGDRVFGYVAEGGAMAEYIVCSVHLLQQVPQAISMGDAAGLPDMWISAIQLLKTDAQFEKRNRIAVFNALSSRGQALVQLAQILGCRRVHCVVSNDDGEKLLKRRLRFKDALPDEVVTHVWQDPLQVYQAIAAYDPKGLEAVINLGNNALHAEMMRPQGRIVLTNPPAPSTLPFNWKLLVLKGIKIHGAAIRSKNPKVFRQHWKFFQEHVLPKLKSRRLYYATAHRFSWRDIDEALELVARSPEMDGRVICEITK